MNRMASKSSDLNSIKLQGNSKWWIKNQSK